MAAVSFGSPGCYCLKESAHHRTGIYPGNHCQNGTVIPGWEKHGFRCSRGHGNSYNDKEGKERLGGLMRSKHIDIGSAAADFYLLESIAYDVANPRPFTVTDIDGFNFNEFSTQKLLKLIGVSGPVTVSKFVEKHGKGNDTADMLIAQYEKWKNILAPNVAIDSSLNKVKREASDLLEIGTAVLADTLRQYAHYANVSELSYHAKFSSAFDSDIGVFTSALGWIDLINHVGGGEAARIAAELFRDKTASGKKAWGTSYGGSKWAQAADVLSYFEDGRMPGKGNKRFDAKLFCDRMFSLQHNTGSILTKTSWGYGRAFDAGYSCDNLIPLLDAHHNSDWFRLSTACSEEVYDMLMEYWTITNREFIRANLEPVEFPTTSPAYLKGSKITKAKPNGAIVEEVPKVSAKANVLLSGNATKIAAFDIPDEVINAGKQVLHKW